MRDRMSEKSIRTRQTGRRTDQAGQADGHVSGLHNNQITSGIAKPLPSPVNVRVPFDSSERFTLVRMVTLSLRQAGDTFTALRSGRAVEYRAQRGRMPAIWPVPKLQRAARPSTPRGTTNGRAGLADIARESGSANSPTPTTAGMLAENRGAAPTPNPARTRRDRMDLGGACERATFIRTQHALGADR